MSWQRRFRDIAIAGGLAACATHGLGASCVGTPACDTNPDPCCVCYKGDTGGYGGAGCVDQSADSTPAADGGTMPVTCASELACAAMPTAACCEVYGLYQAAYSACGHAGQMGSAGGGF